MNKIQTFFQHPYLWEPKSEKIITQVIQDLERGTELVLFNSRITEVLFGES